jgi:hypothetical protein
MSSQWCLVGNIKDSVAYGPDNLCTRVGTKHFSAGTKVFCLPAQWGDGYERIVVIARHRGSKLFARMVIRSDWVTNWRAKLIYNPRVIAIIQEHCSRDGRTNWSSREEVMLYLEKFSADVISQAQECHL